MWDISIEKIIPYHTNKYPTQTNLHCLSPGLAEIIAPLSSIRHRARVGMGLPFPFTNSSVFPKMQGAIQPSLQAGRYDP